jgi:hypothetical protein
MRKLMALVTSLALPMAAFAGITLTTQSAEAVVYCTYIGYPAHCVARPGVRLVARPGARAVTAPRPGNQNGGVNRAGARR